MKSAIVVKWGRVSAGEGHEDDVLLTALLYRPAGGDAPGVGIEDDLEKDGGIIGGSAGVIITVPIVKDGEIEFVIDQVVQGIFEGAGQDLLVKGDGDELALAVVILLVACHRVPPWVGSWLDFMA